MSREKYRSKEWLLEQYVQRNRSAPEIADECGVSAETIYHWMRRHGIDRQPDRYGDKSRSPYATYYIDDQGYPRWQAKYTTADGRVTENFYVHRLLAIAEFGVDAVAGNDVHHRNEIPWDNRPGNIEVLGHGEHRRHHIEKRHGSDAVTEAT